MKSNLRKKVIELRKKESYESIITKSKKISEVLLSLEEVKQASTIMLYLDFNNEVKTDYIVNSLISLGKKVLIPITIKESKTLIPSQIKDLKSEVEIGTYGIREPKQEFVRVTDIESIDVLVVPAVAFDINKFRLGYGGGFYDRFIEKLKPDSITIGLAFELQVFDSIPKENHDAQLNYVITEKRVIK